MCMCSLYACVCVFLLEYQRGEEREGRSPGNNNHPSTTGAFVRKSVGLQDLLSALFVCSTVHCSASYVFVFTCAPVL